MSRESLCSESSSVEEQGLATGVANGQGGELPQTLRYGVAADRGRRHRMEDTCVAFGDIENFCTTAQKQSLPETRAFFALFDGHNGYTAASFASQHMLRLLVAQETFPNDVHEALRQAFLLADREYFQSCHDVVEQLRDEHLESGTTALAALLWGSRLVIANAGDSRAVLSRNGRAIELSRDHKPVCTVERQRVTDSGGFVCPDGLLCGELGVTRALGDFHLLRNNMKNLDTQAGPLTCEPEIREHELTPEDEFLILGTDGLWDVLTSQRAVEVARQKLREHNDPEKCASNLVEEAVRLHTSDNVSVVTMCFKEAPPAKRFWSQNSMQRNISQDGLYRVSSFLSSS